MDTYTVSYFAGPKLGKSDTYSSLSAARVEVA